MTEDRILVRIVSKYKKENPVRTADTHDPHCPCKRCLIDNIENYLKNIFQ